ncbi:unnamed protein product [Phyllotreta striolata]|uniref:Uncharacterized protein n=1 Tax=Phyllotreta striolata TaxID=444603 RepID=A0A9N9TDX1_PHYSR|nr:unnamed protein product [Phyllotreta striolata]
MRTKNFFVTVSVIVTLSLMFVLFGQEKPESIHDIVSTTNEQIRNFQVNLRDAETKTLNADEKYLKILGFVDEPRSYPKDVWTNTSLPVVVTYVREGQESQAIGFVINMAKVLPNNTVLIYNLGLDEQGFKLLTNFCNSSRCRVVDFDLNRFPPHVLLENLHAFRPLIIQDALQHTGAVFFLESNYRLSHNVITKLFEDRALKSGVLAWPLDLKNPVSSLTHKKMFEYFLTDADNFLFLEMVKSDALLIVNTPIVHRQVMLPWVQCALTQDCIFPVGAQSAGCKFDKKPQYRYSGCHGYDASALNVVLGLLFKQDGGAYTCYDNSSGYFDVIPLNEADRLLKRLESNSTTEESFLRSS